jgi:hypothetical protein
MNTYSPSLPTVRRDEARSTLPSIDSSSTENGGAGMIADRSLWKRRVVSPAAARASFNAPATWRLWLVVVWTTLLLQAGASLPVILGGVGLVLTWEYLKRIASSYSLAALPVERPQRRRRRADFAAALMLQAAFAIQILLSLDLLVSKTTVRTPVLMLSATAVGAWMSYSMLRTWWRPTYAVGGAIAGVGALTAGLFLAGERLPPQGIAGDAWLIWLTRLALIFTTAYGLEQSLTPAQRRRSPWSGLARNFFETPTFLLLVSLIVRPPASLRTYDATTLTLWILSAAAVATALGLVAVRLPFLIAQDARQIRRAAGAENLSIGDLPTGWLIAVAMTPALATISFAGWYAWSVLWALGAAAVLIDSLGRILRRSTSIQRQAPPIEV